MSRCASRDDHCVAFCHTHDFPRSASFPFNPAYTGAQPGILRRHDSAKVIVPVHFNGHFLTGASGSTVEYTAGVNQQLYVINNSDGACASCLGLLTALRYPLVQASPWESRSSRRRHSAWKHALLSRAPLRIARAPRRSVRALLGSVSRL